MVINDIDLEKKEFVCDLERNIFLLPKEILVKYHISSDKSESGEVIPETQTQSGEPQGKYVHETVFVFNGGAMYEIPCKIAARHILSKHMRNYFMQYMYYRKWVDIDPDEVPVLSVFFYDLAMSIKEYKDRPDVTGYSAEVASAGRPSWAQQGRSAQAVRNSASSRESERLNAARAQHTIASRVEKPMNTVVNDSVQLSAAAKRELDRTDKDGTTGPDRVSEPGRNHTDGAEPHGGELHGETGADATEGFFDKLEKLSSMGANGNDISCYAHYDGPPLNEPKSVGDVVLEVGVGVVKVIGVGGATVGGALLGSAMGPVGTVVGGGVGALIGARAVGWIGAGQPLV